MEPFKSIIDAASKMNKAMKELSDATGMSSENVRELQRHVGSLKFPYALDIRRNKPTNKPKKSTNKLKWYHKLILILGLN